MPNTCRKLGPTSSVPRLLCEIRSSKRRQQLSDAKWTTNKHQGSSRRNRRRRRRRVAALRKRDGSACHWRNILSPCNARLSNALRRNAGLCNYNQKFGSTRQCRRRPQMRRTRFHRRNVAVSLCLLWRPIEMVAVSLQTHHCLHHLCHLCHQTKRHHTAILFSRQLTLPFFNVAKQCLIDCWPLCLRILICCGKMASECRQRWSNMTPSVSNDQRCAPSTLRSAAYSDSV